MTAPVIAPNAVNIVGWTLIVGSTLVFIAAVAGAVLFATSLGASQTDVKLPGGQRTGYLVLSTPHAVWPMLLCVLLSITIGYVGYRHTDAFTSRHLPRHAEPKDI